MRKPAHQTRSLRPNRVKNANAVPRQPETPQRFTWKAGDRTRTGDPQLGKLMLYQLSYARNGR